MTTFTPQTKNTGTFTAQAKGTGAPTLATAGLYRGFGAFNYVGGEVLQAGSLPTFTSQTKNVGTFTPITKS